MAEKNEEDRAATKLSYEPLSMGDDIEARIQVDREKGRKQWDHSISFVLAAVGSAVGLGNVWRFPYLVSSYGGAPFLIPYFFILIFVGMPILGMELCIGTFFQAGDADAFGSMNPRLRGIGLASIFAGYSITFYYCIILSWAGIYFVESFNPTDKIPWGVDPEQHFYDISMAATGADAVKGTFNWKVFISLGFMWLFIFLSIFKGVKSTSWVVKVTVPLPILILVILIIRGAFLEGAGDGINNYLFKWDAGVLSDKNIWGDAIGQVFFSLGICMGVMTSYSSHNSKTKTNVALCEKAISLSDTGIALLGGFAIYEMLGHMQYNCKLIKPDDQCTYYSMKSMGLAFIAYPEGIYTLEAPQFWGLLFFGCLVMLGIDSAFSLGETMVTFAKDSWVGLRVRPQNWMVTLPVCIIGFLAGILYVFDSGVIWLDIIDRYINNWGMVLIGCLECFAVGWVYKIDDQYQKVGRLPVLIYNVGYFASALIATILGVSLPGSKPDKLDEKTATAAEKAVYDVNVTEHNTKQAEALGVALGVFFIGWIVTTCISYILSSKSVSPGERIWTIMGWHGADDLRTKANNVVRDQEKDGVWVPNTWKHEIQALYRHDCICIAFGFLIKYFSYTLLLVITARNIQGDIEETYGGYPTRFIVVGQLIFVFMMVLVVTVAIFPRILYDPKHSGRSGLVPQLLWLFNPVPAGVSNAITPVNIPPPPSHVAVESCDDPPPSY